MSEDGDLVTLGIGVFGATVPVEVDEHTTVSGSLGGRTSSRALKPGVHVEVEGWMRSDGSVRASEVELKVQTGSMRMTGPIESILDADGVQSILVNGVEFRVDALDTRRGRTRRGWRRQAPWLNLQSNAGRRRRVPTG